MEQSTLSIRYTRLDPNTGIIKQDGKYFAVAEARGEREEKKKKKTPHCGHSRGDMRDTKLIPDLRMIANKFLSRSSCESTSDKIFKCFA